MAQTPTLISTVRDCAVLIQNADGTGNKSLGVAAPAAGSRIKSLIVTSTDTSQRTLQIKKTVGGVDYVLGEIDIPAGSGTDGASNAVNLLGGARLAGLQTDGIEKWLDVANGTTINIATKVAVTAGKQIAIVAEVGDFT